MLRGAHLASYEHCTPSLGQAAPGPREQSPVLPSARGCGGDLTQGKAPKQVPAGDWWAGGQRWVRRAAMESHWHGPKPTRVTSPASSSRLIVCSKDRHDLRSMSRQIIQHIRDKC